MDQEFRPKRTLRKIAAVGFVVILASIALLTWMHLLAISDPVVRKTTVGVFRLGHPIRILLLSDIHVAGPDMSPHRVERIVAQMNALRADVIVITGDFVSDKRSSTHSYSVADAVSPLRSLRAPLGVVAVLGNHDHWRDAAATRWQLQKAGIRVLDNDAARIGPLTIGGVDDPFTGHDDLPRALAAMRAKGAPLVLLSHSPDIFPNVPNDVSLTLAGHTHCGQIRLPLIGALATMSAYGKRYACGRVDENGRTLIVSAGLGTSLLPLRLGAAPDVWLIELRPKDRAELVQANGERGEDRVAIARRNAVERFVDMLETGLQRYAVARQERHLRGAAREPLQRGKAMLGGKLTDRVHPGMKVERRDTRSGLANFGNALPDL